MEVLDKPGYGPWELSADRANAVREILAGEEVSSGHFFMVAGEADTDPLFPDNPYMSPNRRVTITLMREEAPIPADLSPFDPGQAAPENRRYSPKLGNDIRPAFPAADRNNLDE